MNFSEESTIKLIALKKTKSWFVSSLWEIDGLYKLKLEVPDKADEFDEKIRQIKSDLEGMNSPYTIEWVTKMLQGSDCSAGEYLKLLERVELRGIWLRSGGYEEIARESKARLADYKKSDPAGYAALVKKHKND